MITKYLQPAVPKLTFPNPVIFFNFFTLHFEVNKIGHT